MSTDDREPPVPDAHDAGLTRFPAHPEVPEGFQREGRARVMLMTPRMAAIGGMLAFFTVVAVVVVLPTATFSPPPSENWLPLTDQALAGRQQYLANGCVYCHSGFSRPQDVFEGRYYLYPRAAEPGDYYGDGASPNILGSERTGPDLSQEGGMHPDDWHVAHYTNPRFTMPNSIMPVFDFWSDQERDDMIAFNQSMGGKEAALRYATVSVGNRMMLINGGQLEPEKAFPALVNELGDEVRVDGKPDDPSPWGMPWMAVWHMNSFDRGYWLTDNPLPLTEQNLIRGKDVYLARCAGCHGVEGDGKGPAAGYLAPKPFDFTDSKEMNGPGASEGQMYHRILTAGPGTAMESFGTRLSVEDIWRTVLFLRTIPNGGLEETLPTLEMYDDWKPPAPMLDYIDNNPISEASAGFRQLPDGDPFDTAARWLAPGMDDDDRIYVGGKLPMTIERLAGLIESEYFAHVERAWQDARRRNEDLPPREQVFSTEGVVFHAPA
jgi:cbb3-type cytochrome c oxidase subunit II